MTPVIFRKWTNGGEIIAFLPDVSATFGMCMSYEHVGQHGEADYNSLLHITRLASEKEYHDLLFEMVSYGYDDLRVYAKMNPRWQRSAWE